uniref:Uncharacterized protein n=1 Tax=Globodera pallida TaxID=36090 RepID=A0A183CJW9_GLOPA
MQFFIQFFLLLILAVALCSGCGGDNKPKKSTAGGCCLFLFGSAGRTNRQDRHIPTKELQISANECGCGGTAKGTNTQGQFYAVESEDDVILLKALHSRSLKGETSGYGRSPRAPTPWVPARSSSSPFPQ